MPLPQRVTVQLLSQPSPFTWLPSSHSSPAWLTTPSPQRAGAQFLAAVPVTVPVAGGPASTMPCLAGSLNSRPTGTVKEAEAVFVSLTAKLPPASVAPVNVCGPEAPVTTILRG